MCTQSELGDDAHPHESHPFRLVEVIQQLSCCRTAAQVVDTVRRYVRPLLGCDGICIVFRRGDEVVYIGEDALTPLWSGQAFPIRSCVTGQCILQRSPVIIENTDTDERVPHELYRNTFVRSMAAVPIGPAEPIGALAVYWARRHRASDGELSLLSILANCTSVALENVRIFSEAEAARRLTEIQASELSCWKRRYEATIQAEYHAFCEIDLGTGNMAWHGLEIMLGEPPPTTSTLAWWTQRIHPDDREAFQHHLRYAVGHDATYELEYRVMLRGGSYRSVVQRTSHTTPSTSNLLGLISDVTKTREHEERVRRSQRLELLGRLAGGIAHDFNNLLVPILAWSQLSLLEEVPSSVREGLDATLTAGNSARQLVRRLLAFGHNQHSERHYLELDDEIRRLVPLLRRTLRDDIDLRVDLSAGNSFVIAERSQIDQIVMNLVVNAQDALPKGGAIQLSTSRTTDHTPDANQSERVRLCVRDNGRGMDEATRSRIFEPFFTTKAVNDGHGLGLATVLGIVQQYGGELHCRSDLGQGTEFEILLPSTAAPTSREDTASSGVRLSTAATILTIDNSPLVLAQLQSVLTRHGYRVLTACDAASAIYKATRHDRRLELILSDPAAEGMDSDACRQLQELHREVAWLHMSMHPERPVPANYPRNILPQLLSKPFVTSDLLSSVAEALSSISHRPHVEAKASVQSHDIHAAEVASNGRALRRNR